ncbi:MAG: protein tyrosine phosphatase [Roseiflexaceae bacterium]|nr:protein tyrosine phosphatase [Roseiflexaceae bacterium]
MATIVIVGAADTGRSPITAALLRRLLETRRHAHIVESAGVLGHDGDPATSDAQQVMEQTNIDISDHVARTLTDEITTQAQLLVAVDSGSALVARSRFPDAAARIYTLGELAGRQRDIPDPFKMQIGAWLTYTREIEILLHSALPRILTLIGDPLEPEPAALPIAPVPAPHPTTARATPPAHVALPTANNYNPNVSLAERDGAIARMQQLLTVAAQMPGVVDWNVARIQIENDLSQCQLPTAQDDLAPTFVGLLRAAITLTPANPTHGQLAALRDAIDQLERPISQAILTAFTARLGTWGTL